MSKHTLYKTAQLVIFCLAAAASIYIVFSDRELYHQAAVNASIRMLCLLLWFTLGLSFVFLFLDFHYFLSYRKEYKEMDFALHSDPISGIANRFTCDALVEKYLDLPLPDDIASIMMCLSNIQRINQQHGHRQGNLSIADFSTILDRASQDLCFVGRNSGNKFLMIIENATEEKIALLLDRVACEVKLYNSSTQNPEILYQYGIAFHESANIDEITKLIALSDRRIYSNSAK